MQKQDTTGTVYRGYCTLGTAAAATFQIDTFQIYGDKWLHVQERLAGYGGTLLPHSTTGTVSFESRRVLRMAR